MPLQAIIEAAEYDALPDTTVLGKDSFVRNEKENKFFLNLPDAEAGKLAFSLNDSVRKLTDNNALLLRQKGEANAKAEAWEAIGKSPEEVAEQLRSRRPEDLQKLIESHKGEIEQIKKSFADSDAAKTEALKKAQDQLQRTLTKAAISQLRNEFDLNDTADFVLRDFIRAEPKEEGSDEYIVRVYENGQPALHAGEAMKPEQLITNFKEGKKFTAMFNAGDGGGSGASARKTTVTGKNFDGLSPTEKLKEARRAA